MVIFTLARPGVLPKPHGDFSFEAEIPGDSHIAISPPALKRNDGRQEPLQIELSMSIEGGGELRFRGHPNDRGFLGRLEVEVHANSFREATQSAYRALAPGLSSWSTQLDVPVYVWRTFARYLPTGAMHISVTNPYREAPIGFVTEAKVTRDLAGLISLYREALESSSPVYQFLCLFKITEGIRNRRERLAALARAGGEKPQPWSRERVPKDPGEFEPWLNAIYPPNMNWGQMALDAIFVPEARGRKFSDLLAKELRVLRVDVAHALTDETTGTITMIADEALHRDRVTKWLPLTKCIVRRMLRNDFPSEFLEPEKEPAVQRQPKDGSKK